MGVTGKKILRHSPVRVAAFIGLLLLVFVFSIAKQGWAQAQNRKEAERKEQKATAKKDPYGRPTPTRPVKPVIPGVNRNQTDKVFLEYADSLYRTPTMGFMDRERQILKGSVKFRQAGMWMYCDSAYYFPDENSLDAFGHVKMEQGDTLFVFADRLFYDGNTRMARLRCGPTQSQVRMENREVKLFTDSFDYDLAAERGWYEVGGKLVDGANTLTSVYGEYSPSTKHAEFFHDVVLVNNNDGYRLLTDTLYYNTDTHIADIVSRTIIEGENDTIITTSGNYNTQTDYAELTSRSTILHRDSNQNVVTLTGDSIIYDRKTRISRVYKFTNPLRNAQPMVLTDTANKSILIGGFGIYNDSTKEAMVTEYPLLMEFSRPDTLFLRADTILTFVTTDTVRPKLPGQQTPRGLSPTSAPPGALAAALGRTQHHVSEQPLDTAGLRSDSLPLPLDSLPLPLDSLPIPVDSLPTAEEILEEEFFAEETLTEEPLPLPPLSPDSIPAREPPKEFHMALAYPRARFFNKDVQGVADTIRFMEIDSMLYLTRKPVVWSGERQITGNRIDVHLNDSTADWALLPDWGMMAEYIDEDFYNQLSGRKMMAFFENSELKHLDVEKNVQAIFLPMENDSTYNKMVNAESGFLSVDMKGKELDMLKMWPDVSGTVTPTFMAKQADKYLQYFQWLEAIRPRREWYGDRVKWADDLGEVPPELDEYLNSPPVFPSSTRD